LQSQLSWLEIKPDLVVMNLIEEIANIKAKKESNKTLIHVASLAKLKSKPT
jgi:hypothetical protein